MYTRVGGVPAGAVAQSRLTEESIPHPAGLLRVRSLTVIGHICGGLWQVALTSAPSPVPAMIAP